MRPEGAFQVVNERSHQERRREGEQRERLIRRGGTSSCFGKSVAVTDIHLSFLLAVVVTVNAEEVLPNTV